MKGSRQHQDRYECPPLHISDASWVASIVTSLAGSWSREVCLVCGMSTHGGGSVIVLIQCNKTWDTLLETNWYLGKTRQTLGLRPF